MRLFVLGATGKTGCALVAQGLERGHVITAFGRSASSGETTEALQVVIGNPMSAEDVAAALSGHDAVLSALGTRGLGTTSVLVDSARAIIEAMRRARVRRLVVLSSSLVEARSGWIAFLAGRTLLRHIAGDQRAMETLIAGSELDWTLLRPARLVDGALTGDYTATGTSEGIPVSNAGLSREDLAHMMLDTVERGAHMKEIVWLRGGRA
jgi:putative NADH-flavin reductase